jgi:predicted ester cyclase
VSANPNKDVVRRYFEQYHNERRYGMLDEIADPAVIEPTIRATSSLERAFSDYRIRITEVVAEGDLVSVVWSASGTHNGVWDSPLGRVEATHRVIEWTATTTLRVQEGRLVGAAGSNWDHLAILRQMGAVTDLE